MPPDTCRHDHSAFRTEEEIASALQVAETMVAGRGAKWTVPRRRVYELLLHATGPTKAYDLISRFYSGRVAHPPTVYRALDFLEQVNLVHRIASLNAFILCEQQATAHAAAFMICDCCGSATEFSPGSVESAKRAAHREGFRPREVALEVRGRCRECA